MIDYKDLDFEQLDEELTLQIQQNMKELENLNIQRQEIGDLKKLMDSISQIVWEQFILQIAGNAGQDFIKQNNDLKLSLKKADHILNEVDFVNGKLPTHNKEDIDSYKNRYETWSQNFNEGSGNQELNKNVYRKVFDENRPKGSASVAMDHTIPVKEILKDPTAATYMNESEKVAFANDTKINLKELDSAANASKKDQAMKEWLESKRPDTGLHPHERFNIDKEELLERDEIAREEWDNVKAEAKERGMSEGKSSIKSEMYKAAGITVQAVAVALLAKLTRTIFQEVIKWISEENKSSKSLIKHIEKAVSVFLHDFKNNVLLSVDVGTTVILTQLLGEIIPMIRKALLFVKIGGQSLIEVGRYLSLEENKEKETSIKVYEIGKIVTIGFTTAGGIALSGAITAVLDYYVPALSVQIPIIGSPASLLGIFFGGLTSGICGAIALHMIDGALENRLLIENTNNQISIKNDVIELQQEQFELINTKLNNTKNLSDDSIKQRKIEAIKEIKNKIEFLDEELDSDNNDSFDLMNSILDDIE